MSTTRALRFTLLPIAVVFATVAAVLLPACARDQPAAAAAAPAKKSRPVAGPITLAASCVGDFSEGHSWWLSVNSAGQAELTVEGQAAPQRFDVPRDEWEALRAALAEERFFELAEEYGEHVPDGSTRTLAVTAGGETQAVSTYFLMNWVQGDPEKLIEPARAVRLMATVRGWIENPEAVDLRPYDEKVVNAAGL